VLTNACLKALRFLTGKRKSCGIGFHEPERAHHDPMARVKPLASGTLRYMISYMILEDNDIDYDIIGFEMSMIS
jgi:hypothetical protein